MKIIMIMVASADGKTTRWNASNIYHWTSKEDQDHFFKTIENNSLLIMGRKTYEAAKPVMKLSPHRLRIVLTKNPENYKNEKVLNQLEFTSESPIDIIHRLENKYNQALLLGGAQVNTAFLKEDLVDEVWLTLEPYFFGEGNTLISDKVDISLHLYEQVLLNNNGTLLLKYTIKKSS